jgi:hypothetical protein
MREKTKQHLNEMGKLWTADKFYTALIRAGWEADGKSDVADANDNDELKHRYAGYAEAMRDAVELFEVFVCGQEERQSLFQALMDMWLDDPRPKLRAEADEIRKASKEEYGQI